VLLEAAGGMTTPREAESGTGSLTSGGARMGSILGNSGVGGEVVYFGGGDPELLPS
jgi:hypothetical protein